MADSTFDQFPHADWVSKEYGGVPVSNLIEIYQLEKVFHQRILQTPDAADRKRQYHELYERVHILKQRDDGQTTADGQDQNFDRLVATFGRELENKSVLDVGCGNGAFLYSVHRLLAHGTLCGLDTSSINTAQADRPFTFVQEDITTFTVSQQFDVVFSHQVFEHIAAADHATHLKSVRDALVPEGKFIVCLPNRFWGPHDITRIVDNTFSGKVLAAGSHVNESSYTEMLPLLTQQGFGHIRTVLPLGAYFSATRGIRVKPWINQILENVSALRHLNNLARKGGRPIFKNPIMLVAQKV
jgi:2-polyprenyl-3-methyl-5-hydroxy-6-metoxy-1,4-benzoquinol methylase